MPVLYDAHGMRSTVFTRMVGIGIRMVFEEEKASENEKIITVSQKSTSNKVKRLITQNGGKLTEVNVPAAKKYSIMVSVIGTIFARHIKYGCLTTMSFYRSLPL